jgi:hypothetical protein
MCRLQFRTGALSGCRTFAGVGRMADSAVRYAMEFDAAETRGTRGRIVMLVDTTDALK